MSSKWLGANKLQFSLGAEGIERSERSRTDENLPEAQIEQRNGRRPQAHLVDGGFVNIGVQCLPALAGRRHPLAQLLKGRPAICFCFGIVAVTA